MSKFVKQKVSLADFLINTLKIEISF
ncbi:hypothetical protein PTD2_15792 [Pseudoalteromonas tunicata D2]|uniref:Uncharacterized protein n=1 Tax=Pseudoalteromonas tunicata D2 TaxID=87626 RepID=A4CD73_9GAMM|nr:hypothetical protein PTD2_15792 [Pseudoalteromonas tunicata D2]